MVNTNNGSQALIQSMINQQIHYVFGIPGAKVDHLFETLKYNDDVNTPKLIITRNEQDAAFMAAGIGRITGKPGVVAVTSGPGASNLVTGLMTATSEADPVIALGGQVQRDDLGRLTHQSIASKELMTTAVKRSVEVQHADNLSEAFMNAYQTAVAPKAGATFMSLPADVLSDEATRPVLSPFSSPQIGVASEKSISLLVQKIKQAKLPVILAGMRASTDAVADAIHQLIGKFPIPVVETFQGAGIISKTLEASYFGRVGLFRNQSGDALLKESDLILAVGYDPVEYEARNWHLNSQAEIVNLDEIQPEISADYQPQVVIQANISQSLLALNAALPANLSLSPDVQQRLSQFKQRFDAQRLVPTEAKEGLVHPLEIIKALQQKVTTDTTVTVDVGSHYIWMARYFRSYKPRHLLFSNGMQTLGVALPWAIAAALVRPDKPVVAVAGDGGFMYSSQELETAVRLKLPIVSIVFNDAHYDMVRFQEVAKYGKDAGVTLGPVNFAKLAESMGAKGLSVTDKDQLPAALDEAFATNGPTVIDIPVDYRDNIKLKSDLLPDILD